MARNMRVTGTERDDRRMLPAQILIPNNKDIRQAFAAALAGVVHEVIEDACARCGLPSEACVCPCSGADTQPPCICEKSHPRLRYQLFDLDDPKLRHAVVLGHDDGEVDGKELEDEWLPACRDLGIWETLAPRVAVAARRVRPTVRIYANRARAGSPAAAGTSPGGR